MSWWGKHPQISKQEARASLDPRACRICIYFRRAYPDHEPGLCPKCRRGDHEKLVKWRRAHREDTPLERELQSRKEQLSRMWKEGRLTYEQFWGFIQPLDKRLHELHEEIDGVKP